MFSLPDVESRTQPSRPRTQGAIVPPPKKGSPKNFSKRPPKKKSSSEKTPNFRENSGVLKKRFSQIFRDFLPFSEVK